MRTVARLTSFVIMLGGCSGSRSSNDKPPPQPITTPADAVPGVLGSLRVAATVTSSDDLEAELTIVNPGPADLVLTRGALELPMLALEVRRDGIRVNPLPPPVPRPEDAEPVTVRPGTSLVHEYQLRMFSPPLPAGRYTLACLVVACAPIEFTVAP